MKTRNKKMPEIGQAKKRNEIDSLAINNNEGKSIHDEDTIADSQIQNEDDPVIITPDLLSHRKSKQPLIKVSLLSFTDFIEKSDIQKISHILNLKKKAVRVGGGNHYAKLASQIMKFHKGIITFEELCAYPSKVDDNYKVNYTIALKGYLEFLKNNNGIWLKPITGGIQLGDVTISVSPKLGLLINGRKLLIVLYTRKGEPMNEQRASKMLLLMKDALKNGEEYKCCLLDLLRGKPFFEDCINESLLPSLVQEAKTFSHIWNKF